MNYDSILFYLSVLCIVGVIFFVNLGFVCIWRVFCKVVLEIRLVLF